MKVQIIIDYNGQTYKGEGEEVNEETYQRIEEMIVQASKGEVNYIALEDANAKYFFSKEALKNSVITLIKS